MLWLQFLGWFLKPKNILVCAAVGATLFFFLRVSYLKNVISGQNVKIVKMEKNSLDLEYKYNDLLSNNKQMGEQQRNLEKTIQALQDALSTCKKSNVQNLKECEATIKLITSLQNTDQKEGIITDENNKDVIANLNTNFPH